MANNVLEHTIDEEIHLCCNKIVSSVIEDLIGFSSPEIFDRYLKAFSSNFRLICSDPFGSHALEKAIEIAFLRAIKSENEILDDSKIEIKKKKLIVITDKNYNLKETFSTEHRQNCSEFLIKIGKFLLNNLEDFMWDQYASHIMRKSIQCLGGIYVQKQNLFNKNKKKVIAYYTVPNEWTEIVVEYVNRLQYWPQFPDFPYSELSSGLLGEILIVLKKIDKNLCKKFGKKILHEALLNSEQNDDKNEINMQFDEEKKFEIKIENDDGNENRNQEHAENEIELPRVLRNACSARLLETLLTVSGEKIFTQIYAMIFIGHIKVFSKNKLGNFAVQKLIENVKEKENFESIFTEISDSFEDLLRYGHEDLVSALSKGCLKFSTKQGAFLTAIQDALHIRKSKERIDKFFLCLLKLKPYEIVLEDKSNFINLHGSSIAQNILRFNKPILLVNCILNTTSNDLASIFSTSSGSFVADAFLQSKYVGEKSKEKLIRHLDGSYIDLAITKFGSRVIDNLFKASSDELKCKIAKELNDKQNQLKSNTFGRVLYQNLRIGTYAISVNQWKASFNKVNKVEKLFEDIISK